MQSVPPLSLPDNLPSGESVVAEGTAIARDLQVGTSALCEQHGVSSEVAYKQKMTAAGRVMTAMNIGMQTWQETAQALRDIHRECEARGFRVDRYQMNLDRRMGLPRQFWTRAAKETGPMLESREDWQETTRVVPIQPHLGDMMIGSPASVENTCQALEAGVNYIGNMSQFHWKYPGWPGDDTEQVTQTVKALAIMAAKREQGAMVHTYLDDGFPAQFNDYCSYLGWARFERYVVDELIGARLSVSYGGLSHHPVTKAAMILALESVTPDGNMNAFYHGNTTAYARELDENFGVFSIDALYMTLAKLKAGGGAAILSVPVTEPVRIPTWKEIVQIQTVARRVVDDAARLMESLDWGWIEAQQETLCAGGQQFFDNLLQGLQDLDVDITDPLQVLLAVRRMGAKAIEQRFGIGRPAEDTNADALDSSAASGEREPLVASDTYLDFLEQRTNVRIAMQNSVTQGPETVLTTRVPTVLIASADVHEYALNLLNDGLQHIGLTPVVAGTSVDPDELARHAARAEAQVVLISTHNGMALGFAEQLVAELRHLQLSPLIGMGGVLNQDDAEAQSPVDVRADLEAIGIHVCNQLADVVSLIDSIREQ